MTTIAIVRNLKTGAIIATNDWETYYKFTFSPVNYEQLFLSMSHCKGKYAVKKEHLRMLLKEYQAMETSGLTWGETKMIYEFFRRNGKRYGLLKEFETNAYL